MSLLSVAQAVAINCSISSPSIAATSSDTNIQLIVAKANEAGQELAARYPFQELVKESAFSCPGSQGGIGRLASLVGGSGYAGGLSNIYNFVPLTGGTGSGATASITVTNGVVTGCVLTPTVGLGAGYLVGDVLSITDPSGGAGAGFGITVNAVILAPQENQGTIQTLTGPDFGWVLNDTMWDRTTRRPVYGPKYSAEWQQLKAQLMQGPWWQYRIRGNQLLFIPPPAVGDTIYFEWVSQYWVATAGAATVGAQTGYQIDTDVSLLPERIVILEATWRWKQAKKLEYAEDFDKAAAAIADLMTLSASKPKLNLAGAQSDIYPGVLVPSGNWGTN